jgi:aryl-alcohol dehydrogenase-like predicted oxidoreductase
VIHQKFVYGAAKITQPTKSVAYQVISKLYEQGLREIDTAPSYGNSENLIGSMQQNFPNLLINTKVGLDQKGAFTSDHIKRSAHRSLENLKIDMINTLFIHSVPTRVIQSSALKALKELKEQGVCKQIAYSGDGEDLQWALRNTEIDFDAVMFTYNFLDQINLKYLITGSNTPRIYVKRILANGVWRKRTFKDYIKDLLGRSRGHDEYRNRMNELFPQGVVDGYSASINFVRESLPEAKYLIGISNLEQCNRLIDYLKLNKELTLRNQDDFKQVFKDYGRDTYLGPVT